MTSTTHPFSDISVGKPSSQQAERQALFPEQTIPIDVLEYGLGKSRGWWRDLDKRKDPLLYDTVRLQIVDGLYLGTIALLPSREILETLFQLFEHNFDRARRPEERKDVDEVIPPGIFEYDFLPPLEPNEGTLVVQDVVYAPTYTEIPRIQSTVHPAFFLKGLRTYNYLLHRHPDMPELKNRVDRRLIFSIGFQLVGAIPELWFGDQATWMDFANRWRVRILMTRKEKSSPCQKQAKIVDGSDDSPVAA